MGDRERRERARRPGRGREEWRKEEGKKIKGFVASFALNVLLLVTDNSWTRWDRSRHSLTMYQDSIS